VEVFLPGSGGAQIHEFNPSQFPPVGLFWTVPLPARGVEVDLANGTATMTASKVPVHDYTTLQNALTTGNNPPPVPGWISFKVVWQGGVTMMPVTSTDPTKGIFSGTLPHARRKWSGRLRQVTSPSSRTRWKPRRVRLLKSVRRPTVRT
jgi:hypothetical protein